MNLSGSPVHVAPACVGSGKGFDHFGSYVCSVSLHFCKRLFPGLEPMTSWSQGNSITATPGLPLHESIELSKVSWKKKEIACQHEVIPAYELAFHDTVLF
jgi:hypothetical protein